MFRKYDDVERINKEEVEGILSGTIYIFEKLDGANGSVFCDNEKGITICSRNNIIYTDKDGCLNSFRGLVDYIKSSYNILEMVRDYPDYIFYFEWLVKHTINYPNVFLNRPYFFDIYDTLKQNYLSFEETKEIFNLWKVNYISLLATYNIDNLLCNGKTLGEILEDINKTYLNINNFEGQPQQEGIVIKNYNFINKFGRRQWAKIVNDRYIEEKHKPKEPAEVEEAIIEKYITVPRIEKITNKMLDERLDTLRPSTLSEKDTGEILGKAFYDLIQEEIWQILKDFKLPFIKFRLLKKICDNKVREIFFDLLKRGLK